MIQHQLGIESPVMAYVFKWNAENLVAVNSLTGRGIFSVIWGLISLVLVAVTPPNGIVNFQFRGPMEGPLLIAASWFVVLSWAIGPPIAFWNDWQQHGRMLEGIEFERFRYGQQVGSRLWAGFLTFLLTIFVLKYLLLR